MSDTNHKLVILTDKTILAGFLGDLKPISNPQAGSFASDYRQDAKLPQIWFRNNSIYSEFDVKNQTLTGNSFPPSFLGSLSSAVQVDTLTGDIYGLEQIGSNSSVIMKSQAFSTTSTQQIITNKNLSLSNDIKIDHYRRTMWIADTLNNRVLVVGLGSSNTGVLDFITVYFDSRFILPCSLVVNSNTGDAFVRWYLENTHQEVISRLSNGAIKESYYTNGSFLAIENPAYPGNENFQPKYLITNMPGSQSMTLDKARSRLWWISNSGNQTVGMVDLIHNSGRNLLVYVQDSSSSSSSSSSPSSSSSSSSTFARTTSSSSSSSSRSSSSSSSLSSQSSPSSSSSSLSSQSSPSSSSSSLSSSSTYQACDAPVNAIVNSYYTPFQLASAGTLQTTIPGTLWVSVPSTGFVGGDGGNITFSINGYLISFPEYENPNDWNSVGALSVGTYVFTAVGSTTTNGVDYYDPHGKHVAPGIPYCAITIADSTTSAPGLKNHSLAGWMEP